MTFPGTIDPQEPWSKGSVAYADAVESRGTLQRAIARLADECAGNFLAFLEGAEIPLDPFLRDRMKRGGETARQYLAASIRDVLGDAPEWPNPDEAGAAADEEPDHDDWSDER